MTTKPFITQTSRTKTPTTLPSAIDRSERGARSRAKLPPKTSRKAPPSPPTLSASLLSPLVSPQSKHKKDSQRPWDVAHFLDTRNGGGLMHAGLRMEHDFNVRMKATYLFDPGRGRNSTADVLRLRGMPWENGISTHARNQGTVVHGREVGKVCIRAESGCSGQRDQHRAAAT